MFRSCNVEISTSGSRKAMIEVCTQTSVEEQYELWWTNEERYLYFCQRGVGVLELTICHNLMTSPRYYILQC
jgi:hypothetical protein